MSSSKRNAPLALLRMDGGGHYLSDFKATLHDHVAVVTPSREDAAKLPLPYAVAIGRFLSALGNVVLLEELK